MTVYERFAEDHSAARALDIHGLSLGERRVDLPSPFLKRALDIFVSLIVLVVFAPVLASIALLIRLDTNGPVFFHQTRRGLNGKPFDILKFRTMNVLENGDTIRQAAAGDPRITPAGHFLRRLSLDELPQLINVLKGEMSLVGPRPHAVAHDELYGAAIADYDIRQRVKPGITGWAQVHGLRGPTPTLESMQQRVEHDIWYVANRRFLLDVEILFRTTAEVFPQPERGVMQSERRTKSRYGEVTVGGLRTARLSREGMARLMVDDCLASRRRERKPRLIFTANGHSIALAATDAKFRAQLESASLIHADGQPVVWASKLTRAPIPERTATTDFIHDAAAQAQKHGLKFFLLGATEDINARCAATLKKDYPALEISGRRHGYFRRRGEEAQVLDAINISGADVVWVGLGVPLEQDFCIRNREKLNTGWLVTSGGLFNFVAGDYSRAPNWMQRLSLEWLYRLAREPRRLLWRYLTTNPLAIAMMLTRTRAAENK